MLLWTATGDGTACIQSLSHSWLPTLLLRYDAFRPIPAVVIPVFVISALNVVMIVALFKSKRGQYTLSFVLCQLSFVIPVFVISALNVVMIVALFKSKRGQYALSIVV